MPWTEVLISENETDFEATLLSLPMSNYFPSAAQGIKRLPKFVSHLAHPGLHGTSLENGNAVMGMLRRLALRVSLKLFSLIAIPRNTGVKHTRLSGTPWHLITRRRSRS